MSTAIQRLALLSVFGVLLVRSSARVAGAQEAPAIRVQSNDVVVPALVYYKKKHNHLVSDLTASDFHVFQDGQEERIQHLTPTRPFSRDFVDNSGEMLAQVSDTPGQMWGIPGFGPRWFAYSRDYYAVSYVPPPSAIGSCHTIRVDVNRKDVVVIARHEYCNTPHPAYDPLAGTGLEESMQKAARSDRTGKIPLSLQANIFYAGRMPRVDITAEFPPSAIRFRAVPNGSRFQLALLTLAYRKDGTLAARSSDIDGNGGELDMKSYGGTQRFYSAMRAMIPDRHETQINLPPGNYDVRVVLADGTNFGRADVPVQVDEYDSGKFVISSVAVCKGFNDPKVDRRLPSGMERQAWFPEARLRHRFPPDFVPLISRGMEFVPAGDVDFRATDSLVFIYYEVYEPLLADAPGTKVWVRVRIVNTTTGKLESDTGPRDATDWVEAGNPVIHVSQQIALKEAKPGSHLIQVQATDSDGRGTPWRTAAFTLETLVENPTGAQLTPPLPDIRATSLEPVATPQRRPRKKSRVP